MRRVVLCLLLMLGLAKSRSYAMQSPAGAGCTGKTVAQAVKREGLKVETVFAMHQGPTPWEQVVKQIEKAEQP